MVTDKLEKNLESIRLKIDALVREDRLEELTYMSGYSLEALRFLGAPISQKFIDTLSVRIDDWANKK